MRVPPPADDNILPCESNILFTRHCASLKKHACAKFKNHGKYHEETYKKYMWKTKSRLGKPKNKKFVKIRQICPHILLEVFNLIQ